MKNFRDYLNQIGQEELATDQTTNSFVANAFNQTKKGFSDEEVQKLYVYDIPKLGPNGTCSTTHEKEDEPYNLTIIYGLPFSPKELQTNPMTMRLWQLKQVITTLQKQIGCDWLGIYRKVINKEGTDILVKESYFGAFSRAEFPLTEAFAQTSNNSTVGLSGIAKIVQDVNSYAGPYYECDGRVQSEFCCPILDESGKVVGIIDAEAFAPNFFTPEKLIEVAKVCFDLGRRKEFVLS